MKTKMWIVCLAMLASIACSISLDGKPKEVLIVSPIQIEALLPHFDQIVLLVIETDQGDASLQEETKFRKIASLINSTHPKDNTLFCITALKYDQFERLSLFGRFPGLKIIKNTIHYNFPRKASLDEFPTFYNDNVHPRLPLLNRTAHNEYQLRQKNNKCRFLAMNNDELLNNFTHIYRIIYDKLTKYQISAVADTTQNLEKYKNGIYLFKNGQMISSYAGSQSDPTELLNFINVETLPFVTILTDQMIERVFGTELGVQLLLIYRHGNSRSKVIEEVRKQLAFAAKYNRQEQLYAHRVIFCDTTVEFLERYFQEGVTHCLGDNPNSEILYRIMLTVTDFKRFELMRFFFKKQPTWQKIIQFIQDVRMKRIDPEYKSEEQNTVYNSSTKIKKIVGKSFLRQVYGQTDESVIVLFVDSKDQYFHKQIDLLDAICLNLNKIKCGYFDLHLNQHKLITVNSAPTIVLFHSRNKKKAIRFREMQITQKTLIKWLKQQQIIIQPQEPLYLMGL